MIASTVPWAGVGTHCHFPSSSGVEGHTAACLVANLNSSCSILLLVKRLRARI